MKALLALVLLPSLAFGYGADYSNVELQRQKAKAAQSQSQRRRSAARAGTARRSAAVAGRPQSFAGRRGFAGSGAPGAAGSSVQSSAPAPFAYQGFGAGTLKNNPSSAPGSERTSDSFSPAGAGSQITTNEATAQWATGLGVGGAGPSQAAPAAASAPSGAGGNGVTTNGPVLGLNASGQTVVSQPSR